MSNETNQPQQPVQPQTQQVQQSQQQAQSQTQSAPPTQEQPSGNRPVETLRDGALKVAIFQNEREYGTNFSLEPGRIYTDAGGQVRESKSLSGSEPLRMSKLLDKAYDRVGEFKAQLKQQNQTNEQER